MITAAAAGSGGNVSVPLSALITVLGFGLTGMSGFLAWLVKQITLQSRFQAETVIVLKGISDRAAEDRARLVDLERTIARTTNHHRGDT